MAGLRGPERSELFQFGVPPGSKDDGDVRLATEGRRFFPGVSAEGFPKDCSKGLGSRLNWDLVLWLLVK
jgi:hypothetical protein